MIDLILMAVIQSPWLTWLLLILINVFLMMMIERLDEGRTCATWNHTDWTFMCVLAVLLPIGWAYIIFSGIKGIHPYLVKELDWNNFYIDKPGEVKKVKKTIYKRRQKF